MNNTAIEVWRAFDSKKTSIVIILLGLIFVASSWWRSSALGFYSDDWVFLSDTIYLPATLAEYLKVNWYARPVYALIAWSLNLLAGGSPMYWQVISSGTVLVSAAISFGIIAYTAGRLGYGVRASRIGGVCGAVALFFSPWMLGVFVWSTGVLTLWSFILLGAGYLIIEQNDSIRRKCVGSFLVLGAFLSYEAYWFTFIPLLLISKGFRASLNASTIRASLWYLMPLALAVIYQRILLPLAIPRHAKAISVNFSLVLNNLIHFDRFISQAIAPIPTGALYLALLTLAALLLAAKALSLVRLALVVAALGLGFIITAVIHGAAGYGLSAIGVMSRTLAAPGFYFAVLIGTLAAAAASQFDNKAKIPRIAYAVPPLLGFILVLMLIGFVARMSDWTSSKEQSKRVLDTIISVVDQTYLSPSSKDIAVVVQIDGDPNGEIFGASWELSGAVALTAPTLVPNTGVKFLTARQSAWGTVWDGTSVIQTVCSAPPESVVERHSSHVPPLYYRIDPRDGEIIESGRLIKDIPFGCEGISPTLAQF